MRYVLYKNNEEVYASQSLEFIQHKYQDFVYQDASANYKLVDTARICTFASPDSEPVKNDVKTIDDYVRDKVARDVSSESVRESIIEIFYRTERVISFDKDSRVFAHLPYALQRYLNEQLNDLIKFVG